VSPEDRVAVHARGLGKRYELGTGHDASSLYDAVARLAGRHDDRPQRQEIWAIRDVSFEVPTGHVLGIMGRNGSGKSTLMRILARVTAPTEGSAEVRGRVGAMLQVGAGFHPHLTGRDNIRLSGAILGMSRREIDAVEDAIVEFAEIRAHLDTPVKYYSSGMYARLAFSVSAHLDADILLVDEVLSVGDGPFQTKSRDRIRQLVREGRSVLFVSHNLSSLTELCDSAMVMNGGRLVFQGPAEDSVRFYQDEILRDQGEARP
jgi:lipopolysaccharide transport system ATP-binding protein